MSNSTVPFFLSRYSRQLRVYLYSWLGVSFIYRHDPNSQWGFKICKMQAAMKAMIKCFRSTMRQLYIQYVSVSCPTRLSYLEKLIYYIKGVTDEVGSDLSLDSVAADHAHTYDNCLQTGAILTSKLLPRSATIDWNAPSVQEVQKNRNSIQNRKARFWQTLKPLGEVSTPIKGQKLRKVRCLKSIKLTRVLL